MINLLHPLQARKSELERKLSLAKAALIECETALRRVSELELSLPTKIANVRGSAVIAHVSDAGFRAPEDALPHMAELLREAETIDALERLQRDLPAIKAHWSKCRALLTS